MLILAKLALRDMARAAKDDLPLLFCFLPVEIIVLMLGHLDLSSVLNFRLSSQTCRQIVDGAAEQIYEDIANHEFRIITPQTAGDSGITLTAIDFKDESGIERAKASQRTASKCYDECNYWQDFGRAMLTIGCAR